MQTFAIFFSSIEDTYSSLQLREQNVFITNLIPKLKSFNGDEINVLTVLFKDQNELIDRVVFPENCPVHICLLIAAN